MRAVLWWKQRADGTVVDGIAQQEQTPGGVTFCDWYDLDGNQVTVDPGDLLILEFTVTIGGDPEPFVEWGLE